MKTTTLPILGSFARLLYGALFVWVTFSVSLAAQAATIFLSPGDNIQSAVNAAPAGTTFVLRAGVYRMQSVKPKNNDTFVGLGRVTLNGSQVLTFQAVSNRMGLWVASATANNTVHGSCDKDHPLCGYSQDLFIDNQLQTPVGSLSSIKSGSWFFDRTNNKVYLASNPQGHVAELGMQPYAFYGPANNVTVRQMTVEKYATVSQAGAVGGATWSGLGANWLVDTIEARWNHGGGIVLGSASQILNSFIHHNGQLGVSVNGTNSKVINNEISWNNYAGFNISWEAGGAKFCATRALFVQSNYVHDNIGPGLWTDIGAVGTLYERNTVVKNASTGIMDEISQSATIRNNVVKGNGSLPNIWLSKAQIQLQNSSNVQVYGNTVEVPSGYGNGIEIINHEYSSAQTYSYGPAANNYVHDNTITYLGSSGFSGLADDTGGNFANGNLFDYNHYILQKGVSARWTWLPRWATKTWADFRAAGQEKHGSCCN